MFERIDRRQVKADTRAILQDAQVSPKAFFALYLGIMGLLNLCCYLTSAAGNSDSLFGGPVELFVTIFSTLLTPVLGSGIYLYCMAIRRGERAEYLILFDGFSFAGKIIVLYLLQWLFVFLWMLLFIVPGFIAAYRYRFAYINLCANPSLSPAQALALSKQQTRGYKAQLFRLDVSYLGWMLLSTLPTILLTSLVMDAALFDRISTHPLYLAAELICSVVFGLLYMPAYYTSEQAYYETAVRTSGLDPAAGSRDEEAFF